MGTGHFLLEEIMSEDFYTIEQASKISGKSQKTIRRHIAAKYLRASKSQNKYRIRKSDFDVWVKNKNHNVEYSKSQKDFLEHLGKYYASQLEFDDDINWIDISDEWENDGWSGDYKNGYNFIDLFSGAGGLSCGLVMAGFNPVATVEIMPEAVETYKYNFIDVKKMDESVETSDISLESTKKQLYEKVKGKDIHLIVGGFPCQGFSMSGNRVVADKRNSLYLEMKRIVEYLQPDCVVMENVEGLRSMLGGAIEKMIKDDYENIGYDVNVTVLNSADYGVAQTRRRVIFIANKKGVKNYHPKPILGVNEYKTLGEEIERFMNMPEDKKINHIITNHSEEMKKRIMAVPEGQSLYGNYSDAWKKSPWNMPSCTVKENHGGVNIHPKLPRVLTPRELAALQSFPDDFIFKGSKKWQLVQIGNAVPPLLGKAIGLSIKKMLDTIKEIEKNNK